jgi:glycosyltransferase involved in cell wall biosynthesis
VIADSDNLAAAARTLGAPSERVHAIPWGVDRARFTPAAARTSGLIASTRLHERIYDLDAVIDGVAPVLARLPHLRLVIAGDGRLRGALEAHARRRLPAGRYEFTGRLAPDAMAALLARAEIFVSASHSDSTSVSLLEAMASGAVPVVSDLEGNREWVNEGEGARLFPIGSAAGLTAALERALAERAWLEAARERNLRVIAERGDAALNFMRIESVFANLVGARARGES